MEDQRLKKSRNALPWTLIVSLWLLLPSATFAQWWLHVDSAKKKEMLLYKKLHVTIERHIEERSNGTLDTSTSYYTYSGDQIRYTIQYSDSPGKPRRYMIYDTNGQHLESESFVQEIDTSRRKIRSFSKYGKKAERSLQWESDYDTSGRLIHYWQLSQDGPDDTYLEYDSSNRLTHSWQVGNHLINREERQYYDSLGRTIESRRWIFITPPNAPTKLDAERYVYFYDPSAHRSYDTVWQNVSDTEWYAHSPALIIYDSTTHCTEIRGDVRSSEFENRRCIDHEGSLSHTEYPDGTQSDEIKRYYSNGLLKAEESYRNGKLQSKLLYEYEYAK